MVLRIKLKKVEGFSKDAVDDYDDFAIIFHKKDYWSAHVWDNGFEPMVGYSKSNVIESFEWMRYPSIMRGYAIKKNVDLNIIKNAKPVKESAEVEVLDEAFAPKKAGEPTMTYDEKQDILFVPGLKEITGSIDLGKGVYFLLSEGKVGGLLLKHAKKRYKEAKQLKMTGKRE